jgi:tRNA pseudouridine38-40 synthase
MARYQIIIAYDGTEFKGFQRQARARTVQAVLEAALHKIGWQDRSILAAGRTDTGVHAAGQVAAFDLEWEHGTQELQAALNANLPADVSVRQVRLVDAAFHPRFDALARSYEYRVLCVETRDPLRERYAWRVWPAIEQEVLQAAASSLPGTHDFAAFGTPPHSGGSTIRTVYQATWQPEDRELVFEITANAFLYRMVRRVVYVLVAVAQGRLAAEQVTGSLVERKLEAVAGLAPPHGLSLVEVIYQPEILEASPESSGNRRR